MLDIENLTTEEASTQEASSPSGEAVTEAADEVSYEITEDMTAKEILTKCVGCSIGFNWMRSNAKVSNKDRQTLADSVEGAADGFAVSKRLMDSKHEAVKNANTIKRDAHAYWKAMSIPLASQSANGGALPGNRLMRRTDVEAFEEQMEKFQEQLTKAEAEVNRNLESIKAADKKRLGKSFSEEDYPDQVRLSLTWGYFNAEPPSYLAELSPRAARRQMEAVRTQYENTYTMALDGVLDEFLGCLSHLGERLGPVVRLHPPREHAERNRLLNAEVVSVVEEDGRVEADLRLHREKGPKPALSWTGTSREWAALQPREMDNERKRLSSSTVDALVESVDKLRRFEEVLQVPSEIKAQLDLIEKDVIHKARAGGLADELRNSESFRSLAASTAKQVTQRMESEIQNVVQRRVRATVRVKPRS